MCSFVSSFSCLFVKFSQVFARSIVHFYYYILFYFKTTPHFIYPLYCNVYSIYFQLSAFKIMLLCTFFYMSIHMCKHMVGYKIQWICSILVVHYSIVVVIIKLFSKVFAPIYTLTRAYESSSCSTSMPILFWRGKGQS